MVTINEIVKRIRRGRLALVLAAALIPFALSGCLVVAAGAGAAGAAGAVAYIRGELDASVPQPIKHTAAATERAIKDMKLLRESGKVDALSATFKLRNAADDKITVELKRTNPDVTAIKIRVGLFGDEAQSRAILDAIKANL